MTLHCSCREYEAQDDVDMESVEAGVFETTFDVTGEIKTNTTFPEREKQVNISMFSSAADFSQDLPTHLQLKLSGRTPHKLTAALTDATTKPRLKSTHSNSVLAHSHKRAVPVTDTSDHFDS